MIQILFSKIILIIFPPHCYGCRKEGTPLCLRCLSLCKKPLSSPYPFIISCYSFKDPLIKRVVHSIKYFHRKDLISPLCEQAASELLKHNVAGILVPIPMHPLRRMLRGYNHAQELTIHIASQTSLPYSTTIIKRTSLLKQQVKTISRKERLKSQHGAFKISTSVHNKDIILVDDVTTTGATLLEARRILLQSGAKSVYAITIAH